MGNKIIFIISFVFLNTFYGLGQSNSQLPDSLKFKFINTVGKDRVETLLNISHFYSDLNPDSSLYYGNLAASTAAEEHLPEELAKAYNFTGLAHYRLSNIDKAFGDLFKAIVICRQNNYALLEGQTLIKVGGIFGSIGQWDKHYKYNKEAEKIFQEIDDKSWKGFVYNNLGVSHRHSKEFDLALDYYNKALRIANETNNRVSMVMAYGNMSNIFLEKDRIDSALYYLQFALDIEMKSTDTVNVLQKVTLLTNLGSLYLSMDSLDKAETYIKEAIHFANKTNSTINLGNAERFLAEIEFKRGNKSLALQLLNNAYKKVESYEDFSLLSKIEHLKYQIFETTGKTDSALFHYKRYHAFQDTITNRANANEQANLRWSGLIEKKEAEISNLEQQQQILEEKQHAELKAKRLLWVALSISLLVVILLYFSIKNMVRINQKDKQIIKQEREFFQLEKEKAEQELLAKEQLNKVQREKHEMELNLKNKELATLTMQMLNKSESISTLKERVDELKKSASSSNGEFSQQIKKLSSGINDSINLEKDWESFKMHFEEVNKGFFKRLKEKHPNLTSNDLRVCSYLHIHLDTKQIARLLNISPDAVKKKRYRLRKKMELVQKEDIAAHIEKITS